MREFLFKMNLQLFAEGQEGEAGERDGDGDTNAGGGEQSEEADNTEQKLLTQEDFDKAFSRRLASERKKWETQLEEEKKKAAMTEAEKLQAEKEDADKRAEAATSRANQVLISAEAKAIAAQLGVMPERLSYAVKLADLSSVEVEDGEVDVKTIQKEIEKVLKDVPELKASKARNIGSGTNPSSGTSLNADMNDFIRRSAGR